MMYGCGGPSWKREKLPAAMTIVGWGGTQMILFQPLGKDEATLAQLQSALKRRIAARRARADRRGKR